MKFLKLWYLRWQVKRLKEMVVTENQIQEVCSEVEILEREIYALQMKKAA